MEYSRISKWTFDTGAGASLSLGATAISGGMISLRDPDSQRHHFHYGGIGAGLSFGARLTEISVPETTLRNYDLSGTWSSTDFYSNGIVIMTSSFKGGELSLPDFQGAAIFVEAGGGLFATGGVSMMFVGIDPIYLEVSSMAPMFASGLLHLAISQARAVLITGGLSMGPQAGGGVSGFMGMLH